MKRTSNDDDVQLPEEHPDRFYRPRLHRRRARICQSSARATVSRTVPTYANLEQISVLNYSTTHTINSRWNYSGLSADPMPSLDSRRRELQLIPNKLRVSRPNGRELAQNIRQKNCQEKNRQERRMRCMLAVQVYKECYVYMSRSKTVTPIGLYSVDESNCVRTDVLFRTVAREMVWRKLLEGTRSYDCPGYFFTRLPICANSKNL